MALVTLPCGIHTGVVAPQVWVLTQLYTIAPGGSASSVTKQALTKSALTSVITVCCHQLI